MSNHQKNIYIHQNFNKNQIKNVLLENANYDTRPTGMTGGDKGLLYFDTDINRILVWNGNEWKIVKYFDDRDFYNTESVFLEDIWALSSELKTLSEDEAKGVTGSQNIVQYFDKEPTKQIPGSWSFFVEKDNNRNNELTDIVFPRNYGTASVPDFYEPKVETQGGFCIPSDKYLIREYKVGNSEPKHRIEFLDGKYLKQIGIFTSGGIVLPTITFYKYIGPKMSFNIVNGNVNKIEITGDQFNVDQSDSNIYRTSLTGTNLSNINNIASFSVNGQELSAGRHYNIIQISNTYYLELDISDQTGIGWEGEGVPDSSDLFYLNTLNTV